jgi:NAD-dependent SIR2 family protein deacetylase
MGGVSRAGQGGEVAEAIREAAARLREADALLVTAGAGMGVDSGLPDFRGDQGFWTAYPPYAKLGLRFVEVANPTWFREDPGLAWGFYGHRRNLYRATRPHGGFGRLAAWASRMRLGAFVFTSNVDGQFQRAGFDPERIVECHGSIEWQQCCAGCAASLFAASPDDVAVDAVALRAASPHPSCPGCGGLARPNILMFSDDDWDDRRTHEQYRRFEAWQRTLDGARLLIIECGAGGAVPTVRLTSERMVRRRGASLVRINPHEPSGPPGAISLPLGAADALAAIDAIA